MIFLKEVMALIVRNWKKDLLTIPNMLSLFRLTLIPVYVVIYLNASEFADYAIAAGILAVSCLTDLIDGKIARRFNMISTVGKFLDPLADKATQFTLLVCLAVRYPIIWSLAVIMFIKESFQLIAGIIQFCQGNMLTGALITGKICTAVLFASLIILVLMPWLNQRIINLITAIDGIVMLIAFGHYIHTYHKKSPMIQAIEDHEDRKM